MNIPVEKITELQEMLPIKFNYKGILINVISLQYDMETKKIKMNYKTNKSISEPLDEAINLLLLNISNKNTEA